MNEDNVVGLVLDRLDALGVEYMVVGSYASNLYGRPRSSFDADLVVRVPGEKVEPFVRAFLPDFAVEPDGLRRDLESGSAFNLIPYDALFKIDIVPLRRTPFAEEEFRRRRQVRALDRAIWIASPEDVILSKLHWYRRGGEVSGRQVEDARDVYAVQKDVLDDGYMNRWADELGVRDLMDRIRAG
ncbi:MAG: hypothetical protein HYY17_10055 [Planctomycetes bacterium]|nr:hypothetical protein [Planctomycetota bacterium]